MSRARDRADGGLAGVTTGSGNVTITDGNLILDGGNGIDFSDQASPAAGMTSELLDSYEEGTWTAVIDDGSNPLTMNGSWETGLYTKVGNLVTITGWFKTTSLGSATSSLRITGLPFTIADDNGAYCGGGAGAGGGFNITAGESVCFYGSKDQTNLYLNLWKETDGINGMVASEWTDDGNLQIGFSYRAA